MRKLAARLVLIFTATLIGFAPAWSDVSGTKLGAEELKELVPGAVVKGEMANSGAAFEIKYQESGVLKGKSGSHSDTGTWELDEDLICFQWENWRKGEHHCVNLHHQEGNRYCSFFPDGTASACGNYEN